LNLNLNLNCCKAILAAATSEERVVDVESFSRMRVGRKPFERERRESFPNWYFAFIVYEKSYKRVGFGVLGFLSYGPYFELVFVFFLIVHPKMMFVGGKSTLSNFYGLK
jgi:hypothetical protein